MININTNYEGSWTFPKGSKLGFKGDDNLGKFIVVGENEAYIQTFVYDSEDLDFIGTCYQIWKNPINIGSFNLVK